QSAQIHPGDELEREPVGPSLLAEVLDLDDVGMLERDGEVHFLDEALDAVGGVRVLREDALERVQLARASPLRAELRGQEYLRRAAPAEQIEEPVAREASRARGARSCGLPRRPITSAGAAEGPSGPRAAPPAGRRARRAYASRARGASRAS